MNISYVTNQDYLLHEQYKDDSPFSRCLQAMKPLQGSQVNLYHWVFQHIRKAPGGRVLELGCGPGDLWVGERGSHSSQLGSHPVRLLDGHAQRHTGEP